MKKTFFLLILCLMASGLFSQTLQQVYYFPEPTVLSSGEYDQIAFPATGSTALPGDPVLPFHSVALLLPPGHEAVSIEIIRENEATLPGTYHLFPQQHVSPLSVGRSGEFIRNESRYASSAAYPSNPAGTLITEYMNGFGFALCSFTPVTYIPSEGILSYYSKITVSIAYTPSPAAQSALLNLNTSTPVLEKVRALAQNPDAIGDYPRMETKQSAGDMVIITPEAFTSAFQPLLAHYQAEGTGCEVVTTQEIYAGMSGQDQQEKIRNFIIQEYQSNGTGFFLIGGDADVVPFRGFYCHVQSSIVYEDNNIPADLYYSALDGNWNTNGNNLWGEPEEDDLLPDVAVARLPFSTTEELNNMINKTISYQANPFTTELARPFMVGEHMYDNPLSFGSDYLELLIGDHDDNGYFTYGIPEEKNDIIRLYDTLISPPSNYFFWNVPTMLTIINEGRSIIHHAGHSNVNYMMRLFDSDITNENFAQVNGVDHNFQIMYTHGCLCGAFDDECIAEKSVAIQNFLVAGVFNSRYGWFNEGQTEGPSAHLHREFVSALYHPGTPSQQIGETHRQSKIMTAPWVTAPGQWEPGALRWCFYCSNVLGDPVMTIRTDDSCLAIETPQGSGTSLSCYPNPAHDRVVIRTDFPANSMAIVSLRDLIGKTVLHQHCLVKKDQTIHLSLANGDIVSGIYLVTITTNEAQKTGKLIVRK